MSNNQGLQKRLLKAQFVQTHVGEESPIIIWSEYDIQQFSESIMGHINVIM